MAVLLRYNRLQRLKQFFRIISIFIKDATELKALEYDYSKKKKNPTRAKIQLIKAKPPAEFCLFYNLQMKGLHQHLQQETLDRVCRRDFFKSENLTKCCLCHSLCGVQL